MLPDLDLLQDLIRRAGIEELLPRFMQVARIHKPDGSLLTEADLAVDRRLRQELSKRWPAIAFLSEEMPAAEQKARLDNKARAFWCLDPLDGTTNFAAGLPYFAISLALIAEGAPQLGVIYDPIHDECFGAERGGGAWLNGARLTATSRVGTLEEAVASVDLKRLPPALALRLVHNSPFYSQRNFGACALEWAWLAASRIDLYLHGGQKLWDLAAGVLLLAEAQGHSLSLAGSPVFQPTLTPRSVIASPDLKLFKQWQAWLNRA